MVGITSGVYSSESIDKGQTLDRVLAALKQRKEHMASFSIYDDLNNSDAGDHNLRLHLTLETFFDSLDVKKLIKKCLISDNPQSASKLSLMSGNVMQAFDFTLQAYIKSGLVANDFIFQAFIYYLHFPVGNNADELTVKRQLLERLIACWQDQKYSFVLLEKLFIQVNHNFGILSQNYVVQFLPFLLQNFDALLLQILVLTLFCPNEERLVDDGPVLNNEVSGPKLVDLFTPEFCLKVGDTFVKTIKVEENSAPAVTQWLRHQQKSQNTSASGSSSNSNRDPNQLTHLVTQLMEKQ